MSNSYAFAESDRCRQRGISHHGSVLVLLLVALMFVVLQASLWGGEGSLPAAWRLERVIENQKQDNQRLADRNRALDAEVKNLKQGLDALEERARSELGMIAPHETFFQLVERPTGRP